MENNITRFFSKNDLSKLCLMLPTFCGGRRFEPFYEMQQMSLDLFNRQTLLGKYLNQIRFIFYEEYWSKNDCRFSVQFQNLQNIPKLSPKDSSNKTNYPIRPRISKIQLQFSIRIKNTSKNTCHIFRNYIGPFQMIDSQIIIETKILIKLIIF